MSRSRSLCRMAVPVRTLTQGFYHSTKLQCFVLCVLGGRLLWSRDRQPSPWALWRGGTSEPDLEKLENLQRVQGGAGATIHSGQREICANAIRHWMGAGLSAPGTLECGSDLAGWNHRSQSHWAILTIRKLCSGRRGVILSLSRE